MKNILVSLFALALIQACSDAGASSEPQAVTAPEKKCDVKLSAPSYFQGESCPKGDYLLQGIQGVTVNNQVVRGVRCVKLALVCTP